MKSENCNNTSLPAAGKVVGLGELLWDVLPEGKTVSYTHLTLPTN